MAAVSWLKYAYLAHFAKPRAERHVYRWIKRREVCRIVQVGVGNVAHSASLIRVAQRFAGAGPVAYTGIDWFDARSAKLPALNLKQTHCQLQATGAQIRLVPGEPARSLAAVANAHQHTGLVLISSLISDNHLAAAWFYVPRMLDPQSVVFRERLNSAGDVLYEALSAQQIAVLAACSTGRRAA